jgi:hypothetical protein
MNFAAGEKSLLPTASVDVGGVKQTVLAPQIGKTTEWSIAVCSDCWRSQQSS